MPRLGAFGFKAVRFALVGLTNSALYAIVTALCAEALAIPPVASSIIGYLAVLPFAFVAHKRFTFRSRAAAASEIHRFIITYLIGLGVATGSMFVVEALGWHYGVGILAAVVLVPAVSLLVLDRWVFASAPTASR